MKVIKWLLNHDPALRPTAQELLKSELLPPPQMEESELHEVLQHTMANINGKAYRTMVGQLFAQNTSPVMDYTYDIDLHKVRYMYFEQDERGGLSVCLTFENQGDSFHVWSSSET